MKDFKEIKFYTVEEFQNDWDAMIERVENGETLGIENEDGQKAVMVPQSTIDENEALLEFIKMHTEDNNEAL